jgi:hypothetical protein
MYDTGMTGPVGYYYCPPDSLSRPGVVEFPRVRSGVRNPRLRHRWPLSIEPFVCVFGDPTFERRDTESSERSESTERAVGGWKRMLGER